MKQFNFAKGRNGEGEARKYLESVGFDFVEGNHVNPRGEIDLIMSDKEELVFVEVKLKTSDRWGNPEEMIDKRKLSRVRAAAEAFLVIRSDLASKFKKYRVDAVCIDSNQNMEIQNIRHYKGIY